MNDLSVEQVDLLKSAQQKSGLWVDVVIQDGRMTADPSKKSDLRRLIDLGLLEKSDYCMNEFGPDQVGFSITDAGRAALEAAILRRLPVWRPIEQKPADADWIVYLPDGAEDGLGWALDPDERLAALLWWQATGPGRSEVTHFRDPIAGPTAAEGA